MMRLILILFSLVAISYSSFSQDCFKESDCEIIVNDICETKPGSIELIINDPDFKWEKRQFALYRPDINDFERNALDERIVIVGNKVIFDNINNGEYQIAFYNKECSTFPRPILFPESPLVLVESSNCH